MTPTTKDPGPVVLEENKGRDFDVYRSLREEAGPDYWPISTLADFFGVNVSTLRAQTRAGHIPRPSLRATKGALSLQLYTKEDAEAIQAYYDFASKPLQRRLEKRRSLGNQKW